MQLKRLEPTETAQSHDDGFNKKQHVNTYTAVVILFITLSSAAYGYAGSVIATTLTQPSFTTHMKLDTAPNSEAMIGAMNALFYTGGVIGSFFAGWSSKRFGRKFSTGLGNVLLIISGALMTASVNPAMFIVFRFVSGFGYVADFPNPDFPSFIDHLYFRLLVPWSSFLVSLSGSLN